MDATAVEGARLPRGHISRACPARASRRASTVRDKEQSKAMAEMAASRKSHFMRDDNSRKTAAQHDRDRRDSDDGLKITGVTHVMS